MVGGYAKFESEHLTAAAERIERGRDKSVIDLSRFCDVSKAQGPGGSPPGPRVLLDRTYDQRIKSPTYSSPRPP